MVPEGNYRQERSEAYRKSYTYQLEKKVLEFGGGDELKDRRHVSKRGARVMLRVLRCRL